MERKYLKNLLEWKDDKDRKPLLVLGARQVGKTYLIEQLFAKVYYKKAYLRIDCSNDPEFVDYVFKNDNLDKVLQYIQLHYDFPVDKNHLLFFDEVQECLPIIKMMKHFCEQKREVPVIVSGSLVRIKINRYAHKRGGYADKRFLFPVGKISRLVIYPLTFDEFVFNYRKNIYGYIKNSFINKSFINEEIHKELMDVFNDYLFVGGMPEVVNTFIKYKDDKVNAYLKCYDRLSEIYSDYLADMELYQASSESIMKSRLIFRNIYSQLNKGNKNFKVSQINEKYKNRDVLTPIEWLITANIVNKSCLLKEYVTSPLIENNGSMYRLYLSDMGLFTFQSGVNAKSFILDKNNTLSGIFYENYVSIELVARKYDLFYWKGKRNSELEFLIDFSGTLIPIDCKKNKSSLNSVIEYRTHNRKSTVIKVSNNHYGYDENNDILTIPYYYLSFYLDA